MSSKQRTFLGSFGRKKAETDTDFQCIAGDDVSVQSFDLEEKPASSPVAEDNHGSHPKLSLAQRIKKCMTPQKKKGKVDTLPTVVLLDAESSPEKVKTSPKTDDEDEAQRLTESTHSDSGSDEEQILPERPTILAKPSAAGIDIELPPLGKEEIKEDNASQRKQRRTGRRRILIRSGDNESTGGGNDDAVKAGGSPEKSSPRREKPALSPRTEKKREQEREMTLMRLTSKANMSSNPERAGDASTTGQSNRSLLANFVNSDHEGEAEKAPPEVEVAEACPKTPRTKKSAGSRSRRKCRTVGPNINAEDFDANPNQDESPEPESTEEAGPKTPRKKFDGSRRRSRTVGPKLSAEDLDASSNNGEESPEPKAGEAGPRTPRKKFEGSRRRSRTVGHNDSTEGLEDMNVPTTPGRTSDDSADQSPRKSKSSPGKKNPTRSRRDSSPPKKRSSSPSKKRAKSPTKTRSEEQPKPTRSASLRNFGSSDDNTEGKESSDLNCSMSILERHTKERQPKTPKRRKKPSISVEGLKVEKPEDEQPSVFSRGQEATPGDENFDDKIARTENPSVAGNDKNGAAPADKSAVAVSENAAAPGELTVCSEDESELSMADLINELKKDAATLTPSGKRRGRRRILSPEKKKMIVSAIEVGEINGVLKSTSQSSDRAGSPSKKRPPSPRKKKILVTRRVVKKQSGDLEDKEVEEKGVSDAPESTEETDLVTSATPKNPATPRRRGRRMMSITKQRVPECDVNLGEDEKESSASERRKNAAGGATPRRRAKSLVVKASEVAEIKERLAKSSGLVDKKKFEEKAAAETTASIEETDLVAPSTPKTPVTPKRRERRMASISKKRATECVVDLEEAEKNSSSSERQKTAARGATPRRRAKSLVVKGSDIAEIKERLGQSRDRDAMKRVEDGEGTEALERMEQTDPTTPSAAKTPVTPRRRGRRVSSISNKAATECVVDLNGAEKETSSCDRRKTAAGTAASRRRSQSLVVKATDAANIKERINRDSEFASLSPRRRPKRAESPRRKREDKAAPKTGPGLENLISAAGTANRSCQSVAPSFESKLTRKIKGSPRSNSDAPSIQSDCHLLKSKNERLATASLSPETKPKKRGTRDSPKRSPSTSSRGASPEKKKSTPSNLSPPIDVSDDPANSARGRAKNRIEELKNEVSSERSSRSRTPKGRRLSGSKSSSSHRRTAGADSVSSRRQRTSGTDNDGVDSSKKRHGESTDPSDAASSQGKSKRRPSKPNLEKMIAATDSQRKAKDSGGESLVSVAAAQLQIPGGTMEDAPLGVNYKEYGEVKT